MADEIYRIIYEGDPSRQIRAADAVIAKLKQVDAQADRTNAKLRSVGADTSGLTKFTSGLTKLLGFLKNLVADANRAEKELKDVGKGNNSVGALTKRLADLEAQLKAVTAAGQAAGPALTGVGKGAGGGAGGGAGSGGGSFVGGVAKGALSHLAFSAFRAMSKAPAAMAADRREFYGKAVDMASDFRGDLKELAALQGKVGGADDDMIRSHLGFTKASGLNPEDAMTHRLEYGGAIGTVPEANLGAGVKEGLELESARFGARYSLDPQTSGRLAGLIGTFSKIPTVQEGAGQMAEAAEIANVYGVGQVKGIMASGLSLTGEMLNEEGGRFKSLKELTARLSATTGSETGSAPRSATRIRQANRLLRKAIGQYGITEEDDYETALRKIAPSVTGPGGDLALQEAGFHNATEVKAVINQAKQIPLVDRIMADPKMSAARSGVTAANEAFQMGATGKQQAAENQEFESMVLSGLAGTPLKQARTEARSQMIRSGTLKPGGLVEFGSDKIRSLLESYGGVSGEDLNVDERAVANLRREGKKYGVDVDRKYPELGQGGYFSNTNGYSVGTTAGTDEAKFQRQFGAASAEIDAARKLKQGAALIIEGANAMGNGGQGPPPPGNGGAGVNPGRP